MSSYGLGEVERLTVGTVGEPGSRVFFLQARRGRQLVTLKLEKSQVSALSEFLGNLLEDLPSLAHLPEDLEPEEPTEPDWPVGSLRLSYDETSDRVVLVAEEAVPEGDKAETARLLATREQVAALAIRGTRLVESGRPPCPLCGYPLDPRGHLCPRTNGHRPPTL